MARRVKRGRCADQRRRPAAGLDCYWCLGRIVAPDPVVVLTVEIGGGSEVVLSHVECVACLAAFLGESVQLRESA